MNLLRAPALIAITVAYAIAHAQTYRVTDLGALGGHESDVRGVNASGKAVGRAYTTGDIYYHAFLYSNGQMNDIGSLGGNFSYALGINGSGQVVGTAYLADGHTIHAFRYSNGQMVDLGTLGGSGSAARGINAAGQVTGDAYTLGDQGDHAFLYSNGQMQDLGTLGGPNSYGYGVNGAGQVAGTSSTSDPTAGHAFLYANGTMQDLGTLGGKKSDAYAINDAGQVVGSSLTNQDFGPHAFLYSNGQMGDLGTLGGASSAAYGINASGQVVGWSYTSVDNYGHAFVYADGAMRDLNSLMDASGAGLRLDAAFSVSDNGLIGGTAVGSNGKDHAVLLTPYFVGYPTAYSIVKGQFVSGSVYSMHFIDGSYLVVRTNAARQRSSIGVTITIDGASPLANPSDLRLNLTSHVNSTNLGQKVEMFDYVANAWVMVGSAASSQSDSMETANATNPGRFVQSGTNAMKARLSWNPTGIASAFPWSVSIDQAVWNVSP